MSTICGIHGYAVYPPFQNFCVIIRTLWLGFEGHRFWAVIGIGAAFGLTLKC